MSFVSCPLCGKMTSLRLFNPQALNLDVYVQHVKGLGRGRGFKVVNRSSALGMLSITQPIKNRLIDLVVMLNERGLLSEEEIAEPFGFKDEQDALKADLSETEGHLNDARAEVKRYSAGFNELVGLLADALDEDCEDWEFEIEEEDKVFGTLKYGVERLIEDYQALRANIEEDSRA